MYRDDKRSGKGTYYYKDGMLCYSGDWSENLRQGVGVGVSAKDGSMHIGQWSKNRPEGTGVRMTADGEIQFIRKALPDGGSILMRCNSAGDLDVVRCDKTATSSQRRPILFQRSKGDLTNMIKDYRMIECDSPFLQERIIHFRLMDKGCFVLLPCDFDSFFFCIEHLVGFGQLCEEIGNILRMRFETAEAAVETFFYVGDLDT